MRFLHQPGHRPLVMIVGFGRFGVFVADGVQQALRVGVDMRHDAHQIARFVTRARLLDHAGDPPVWANFQVAAGEIFRHPVPGQIGQRVARLVLGQHPLVQHHIGQIVDLRDVDRLVAVPCQITHPVAAAHPPSLWARAGPRLPPGHRAPIRPARGSHFRFQGSRRSPPGSGPAGRNFRAEDSAAGGP